MNEEYIVLFTNTTTEEWEEICKYASTFDVEKGDGPEYSFDARCPSSLTPDLYVIYWWCRDGWTGGFYHGYLSIKNSPDGWSVIYTRGRDPRCMSITLARDFLSAIFETVRNK